MPDCRMDGRSLPWRECGLKLFIFLTYRCLDKVTPLAGVWIEIGTGGKRGTESPWSLPWRECGLKSIRLRWQLLWKAVTPLAGVWIEILPKKEITLTIGVTPLAGVWIEIFLFGANSMSWRKSLPWRECGLKSVIYMFHSFPACVTPLAGVWIEILQEKSM